MISVALAQVDPQVSNAIEALENWDLILSKIPQHYDVVPNKNTSAFGYGVNDDQRIVMFTEPVRDRLVDAFSLAGLTVTVYDLTGRSTSLIQRWKEANAVASTNDKLWYATYGTVADFRKHIARALTILKTAPPTTSRPKAPVAVTQQPTMVQVDEHAALRRKFIIGGVVAAAALVGIGVAIGVATSRKR